MTGAQLIVQTITETRTQFQAVCTEFFQIMTIYQTLFSILLRHYTTKTFFNFKSEIDTARQNYSIWPWKLVHFFKLDYMVSLSRSATLPRLKTWDSSTCNWGRTNSFLKSQAQMINLMLLNISGNVSTGK